MSRLVRVTRRADVAASNSGHEPRAGNVGPRVDVHRQRNELDAITLLRNEFFLASNLAPFVICVIKARQVRRDDLDRDTLWTGGRRRHSIERQLPRIENQIIRSKDPRSLFRFLSVARDATQRQRHRRLCQLRRKRPRTILRNGSCERAAAFDFLAGFNRVSFAASNGADSI